MNQIAFPNNNAVIYSTKRSFYIIIFSYCFVFSTIMRNNKNIYIKILRNVRCTCLIFLKIFKLIKDFFININVRLYRNKLM